MSEFPISFTLEFPYKRTLGPMMGPFFTALRDGKILGNRCGKRIICPPIEYDLDSGETLEPDFVEVGPSGTVENFTWIAEPSNKHPLQEPFAFAMIKLDGADTAIMHAIKAASPDAVTIGTRVTVQFREERAGDITDIYFVPEAQAQQQIIEPGEKEVQKNVHHIALLYEENLYPARARYAQGLLDGKFIGQRSPVTGKVSLPSKGYDAISGVMMSEADDVELPNTGTAVAFTVIAPMQYQGQTKTETYISALIFLDGCDQGLVAQEVRGIPVEEFRAGIRLRAKFKPAAERNVDDICNSWAFCTTGDVIEVWEPTGEPDVPKDQFPELM